MVCLVSTEWNASMFRTEQCLNWKRFRIVTPWRWRQYDPPKHPELLAQRTASHPRRTQFPRLTCPYPEASAVSGKACNCYTKYIVVLINGKQLKRWSCQTLLLQGNSHEMCVLQRPFNVFLQMRVLCEHTHTHTHRDTCPLWAHTHTHTDTCPLWAHTQTRALCEHTHKHMSSVSTHTDTCPLWAHTCRHVSSVSTHTHTHTQTRVLCEHTHTDTCLWARTHTHRHVSSVSTQTHVFPWVHARTHTDMWLLCS